MDFELTEEQKLIEQLTERFAKDAYGGADRWEEPDAPPEIDRSHWTAFAELGLTGLLVPQSSDGAGGGAVEAMLVAKALGRNLAALPFVSFAVVGARLLADHGDAPLLIDGSLRPAIAWQEPARRYDVLPQRTVAARSEDGWTLNGEKTVILDSAFATHLIVSASVANDDAAAFLVPLDAAGLTFEVRETFDGRCSGECKLTDVAVPAADRLSNLEGFLRALDKGIFALASEAVGAMEALVELTTEYLRTRKQFGKLIGSFQALQHRLADMQSWLERARSILLHAIATMNGDDAIAARRAISSAKILTSEAGRFIGQNAVQLHGGIGITDALSIGNYFKRLTAIELAWGDEAFHLDRLIELDVAK